MRQTCLDTVYELAREDERVVFIGSDLGVGTLDVFRDEMPDRFFMEGISEANVVTMAAGLAMNGWIPYVNTIAPFFTRRAYEQILLDLCLHRANVRLLGNGGGMVYAPLGPTHMVIEDLAVLRAIPGMTILAPADAEEMRRLMRLTLDYTGPLYVRFGKGFDPVVTRADEPVSIGKAVEYASGEDVLLVSTGVTLQVVLAAAEQLREGGVAAGVLHYHTIKPFDRAALLQAAARVKAILTVEEHSIVGGLGGTVAELLLEADLPRLPKFRRIGVPDVFPDDYGSQNHLMGRYGISAEQVAEQAETLLRKEAR